MDSTKQLINKDRTLPWHRQASEAPRADQPAKIKTLLVASHGLPTPVVDVRLQFPCNHSRNSLLQPDIPIQCIVSLLVEEELPTTPQPSIWLAISVKVRRRIEATVSVVKVKHATFSDIEEEPGVDAAPV